MCTVYVCAVPNVHTGAERAQFMIVCTVFVGVYIVVVYFYKSFYTHLLALTIFMIILFYFNY